MLAKHWAWICLFLGVALPILLLLWFAAKSQGGLPDEAPDRSGLVPRDMEFPIAIVADMDTESKVPGANLWRSYICKGVLTRQNGKYTIRWTSKEDLQSSINAAGRGMELSDLVVHHGRLLAPDDRTGVLYALTGNKAVPANILSVAADNPSLMKAEWSTVKDEELVLGGNGKEYCRKQAGSQELDCSDLAPMWVARLTSEGIRHEDWTERYNALRKAAGLSAPGWILHEAVRWSPAHKRWYFLPRRASTEPYTAAGARRAGSNLLLAASEDFSELEVLALGKKEPLRGFSAFEFIPGSQGSHVVALKTMETKTEVETYIGVYHLQGQVLMEEIQLPWKGIKFEGLALVDHIHL